MKISLMKQFNKQECQFIQSRASERIQEILDALGIEYNIRVDYLQFKCPIHNGDNHRSAYWAIQTSHWKCMTRYCHKSEITGRSTSIFGLIRGTLSNQTNKEYSFQQTVNYVSKILGLYNLKLDEQSQDDIEINKIIQKNKKRNQEIKKTVIGEPIANIVPFLKKDNKYYPSRGISKEIIDKYYISICENPQKPFYQRAFFPILDESGKYILGWSGRSIFEKCNKCTMYHNPSNNCPNKNKNYAKWKHSYNFKSEQCLYNYWFSKFYISKYGTAIVCEGPGDVWSLEQAGIKNSVALFGLSCSKKQKQLLQKAGALTLVFILDNDEAGENAKNRLKEQLEYYFRLFFMTPENFKDVGEMMHKDIQEKILPFMEKISLQRVLCKE